MIKSISSKGSLTRLNFVDALACNRTLTMEFFFCTNSGMHTFNNECTWTECAIMSKHKHLWSGLLCDDWVNNKLVASPTEVRSDLNIKHGLF